MQIEVEEEYAPVLIMLLARLRQSRSAENVEKNGDWSNYSEQDVFEAVAGEFDEYREAYVIGQMDGPHGQVSELFDVAVTAIKGIGRLSPLRRALAGTKVGQGAN